MKIGHHEFADIFVNRLAIAEHHVIGLRQSAPITAHFKRHDDVVKILPRGLEIYDIGLKTML